MFAYSWVLALPVLLLAGLLLVAMVLVQRVIAHRYDVMAKYTKSCKIACREEIARLKASRDAAASVARIETAGRWLHRDVDKLSPARRVAIEGALAESPRLAKLHEMRRDLVAIWDRSSASSEQLLVQLQDWCCRAEESGVRTLQEFSLRLRSYA